MSDSGTRPIPMLIIAILVIVMAGGAYTVVHTNQTCGDIKRPPHPRPFKWKNAFKKAERVSSDHSSYSGGWECRDGKWQIKMTSMFGDGWVDYNPTHHK